MKVLIQNYTTNSTTEPLYINECINSIEGCEATVWDKDNISAYDMFDVAKPDLFITHFSLLTEDTIKYLSQNNHISAIFNITMAQQEHVDQLNNLISENKIQCPFVFTNQPKTLNRLVSHPTKLVSIMHGADIFLPQQGNNMPQYEIKLGIMSNYKLDKTFDALVENFDSYHYLTQRAEISSDFDLTFSEMQMHSLWNNYKNMVITMDSSYLPQSFFDAIVYGNSVFYCPKYESQREEMNSKIQSILGISESLSCKFEHIVSGQNQEYIKKTVLNRHTCIHRVKRMFSQLKHSEIEKSLSQMAEGIKIQ
jgi:hypothetical protein